MMKTRKGGFAMTNTFTNIGEALKSLRESSGFTQANIASFLKVDQSYISKYESGERSISVDMLEKLAILFGVDMSVFSDRTASTNTLSFALRASEISEEDFETICAINKIALNGNFMNKLLAGDYCNG